MFRPTAALILLLSFTLEASAHSPCGKALTGVDGKELLDRTENSHWVMDQWIAIFGPSAASKYPATAFMVFRDSEKGLEGPRRESEFLDWIKGMTDIDDDGVRLYTEIWIQAGYLERFDKQEKLGPVTYLKLTPLVLSRFQEVLNRVVR